MDESHTLVKGSVPRARVVTRERDLVGESLLHFRIVERLGAGGMGVVYRAFDEKLRRTVALKVLAARYVVDERNMKLIFREARSAAALTHPNIAAIHEVHEVAGSAFFVMELVEGETLRERIERQGRMPVVEALRWAAQIARALGRAHAAGIVHRDLKADNVMIAQSGEIKLLDFGLAKLADDAEPLVAGVESLAVALGPTIPASTRGTEPGRVMGTPAYMAPEQARGEPVDARADVFAFGVVLYEMLAGTLPFPPRRGVPSGETGSGDWKVATRVSHEPRGVAALVTRCLAFDRVARFADGTALATELDRLALRIAARRRVRLAAIVTAGVLAVGLGTFWLATPRDERVVAPAIDPCERDATAVDQRWDAAARAKTAAVYHDDKHADDDLASFDCFARDWKRLRRVACQRAAVDETRDAGRRQARCLDRALEGFVAVTSSPPVDLRGVTTWPRLAAIDWCDRGEPTRSSILLSTMQYLVLLSPDGQSIAIDRGVDVQIRRIDGTRTRVIAATDETLVIDTWPSADRIVGHESTQRRGTDREVFIDPETGTIEQGQPLPDGTFRISPDLSYVVTLDHEVLELRSLRDPGHVLAHWRLWSGFAWSPDGSELAYVEISGIQTVINVLARSSGARTAIPIRTVAGLTGSPSPLWLDNQTLVLNGQSEPGRGEDLWVMSITDGKATSVAIRDAAAPRTATAAVAAASGRVLAAELSVTASLVRIVHGTVSPLITLTDARRVHGVTPDGYLAVARDSCVGLLAISDGSYTQLGTSDEAIAVDRDRVLIVGARRLFQVGRDGTRRVVADLPADLAGHQPYLDCGGGTCVLRATDGSSGNLGHLLRGSELAGTVSFGENVGFQGLAVAHDGRRIALTGGASDHVAIVDVVTGHRESWPISQARDCSPLFAAWAAGDERLVVITACTTDTDAFSHILELRRGQPAVDVTPPEHGVLGAFALGPDGAIYATSKQSRDAVVVIDHL